MHPIPLILDGKTYCLPLGRGVGVRGNGGTTVGLRRGNARLGFWRRLASLPYHRFCPLLQKTPPGTPIHSGRGRSRSLDLAGLKAPTSTAFLGQLPKPPGIILWHRKNAVSLEN